MTDREDRYVEILQSGFEAIESRACDSCLAQTEKVVRRQGIEICDVCNALFWVAEVLFDSDAQEVEIIPTLALATRLGSLAEMRDTRKREATAREWMKECPSFGVLSWSHMVAITALIALIPVGFVIPTLARSAAAGSIVVALAMWDTLVYQGGVRWPRRSST